VCGVGGFWTVWLLWEGDWTFFFVLEDVYLLALGMGWLSSLNVGIGMR